MKRLALAVLTVGILSVPLGCSRDVRLDEDQMIALDAEALAETGIGEAYQELLPKLREWVAEPAGVEEIVDPDRPSYSVVSQGIEYPVYAPELADSDGQSWGRATFALFSIVNRQLQGASQRFYAVNGGNELGGIFLTEAECEAAKRSLPNRTDWPYEPTDEEPWFGQFH